MDNSPESFMASETKQEPSKWAARFSFMDKTRQLVQALATSSDAKLKVTETILSQSNLQNRTKQKFSSSQAKEKLKTNTETSSHTRKVSCCCEPSAQRPNLTTVEISKPNLKKSNRASFLWKWLATGYESLKKWPTSSKKRYDEKSL